MQTTQRGEAVYGHDNSTIIHMTKKKLKLQYAAFFLYYGNILHKLI